MLEVRLKQGQSGLAQPEPFGERRYRMNRWLPLAPAAGLIGTMLAILVYPPLERSFYAVSVFIVFVICIVLVSQVQKRQKRGDDVSSFSPMTNWIALIPVGIAVVLLINGALDRSLVESHRVVVMQKTVRHGKSYSYYLETSSWRANHLSEELQVSYPVFGQFHVNDEAIVEVHRGALGIPWLGRVRKGS
jgi:hypothetical protein